MHSYNKTIGSFGENLAENYLINNGYKILNKNFSTKIGEIDIIAKDEEYICFIEVKTRFSSYYGLPCEAVNKSKQKKIIKNAKMFILKNKLFNSNFRFDVVEVILNYNNNSHNIKIIKNAFQL